MGVLFWWKISFQPVDPANKEKTYFTITKGSGLEEISAGLKEKGLIKSPLFFKILVYQLGINKKIKAGGYYLSSSLSPKEIALSLTKGNNDQWVTIIEGLRQEEIADKLLNEGFKIDPGQWTKEINLNELEGKLFPDSYFFPRDASAGAILTIMQKNFQKKVTGGLQEDISLSKLTFQEIIILASIVEREARHDEDRAIVAGILLKRRQNNWALQVDATVQYAIGTQKCTGRLNCEWWPKSLTKKDLQLKSPYNLYLYRGLPPSPICNPGLSSIKAVLMPQQSPYWYYLSDHEGIMRYAKTDIEHQKNIQTYLQK